MVIVFFHKDFLYQIISSFYNLSTLFLSAPNLKYISPGGVDSDDPTAHIDLTVCGLK